MSFGFAFHSKTKGGAGCSKAFRLRQFGHRTAFTFMLVLSYERHSGGRGAAFRQRNGGAGRRVHPLHIFFFFFFLRALAGSERLCLLRSLASAAKRGELEL